jgi:putative oxidoreductase
MFSESALSRYTPFALAALRIMSALLFLAHGTQKLIGFPMPTREMPAFLTLHWFAGVIELVCGVLLALGFLTRPAAFLASGMCAFAYFIAHAPRNFHPALNGGDAAILYCFVFLLFVFAGPGAFSLDGLLRRR